ncbi:hypothetical protein [Haloarchaeobius iranensis]|uniref:hypothetical protein n=1 Tax=Haloarchaeobius iranensis TaxID=996166 RepID=UPI0011135DA0|nr:hypothetical protein [Haloarchaeobius iranensis]
MRRNDSLSVGKLFLGFLGLSAASALSLGILVAAGATPVASAVGIADTWLLLCAVLTPILVARYRHLFLGAVADLGRVLHPGRAAESGPILVVFEAVATAVLAHGTLTMLLHAELGGREGYGYDSYSVADALGWETVLGVGEIGAVVVFVGGWLLWGAAWVVEGLAVTESG